MTRLTDPDPCKTYQCPRCRLDVPLTGFRLLYRGTKRALRCRDCEAAAASPGMARYYAKRFERQRIYKERYNQQHPDVAASARARYNATHAEEVREYKAGWYQLRRGIELDRAKERYRVHADERKVISAARYAARHRTPEAIAARQTRREQRRSAKRAAWRLTVLTAVAQNFGLTADQVLRPGMDKYQLEARRMAILCTHKLRRACQRHSITEIAADFDLSVRGTKLLIDRSVLQLRHRHTDEDGAWSYEVLQAVREHLATHKTSSKEKTA